MSRRRTTLGAQTAVAAISAAWLWGVSPGTGFAEQPATTAAVPQAGGSLSGTLAHTLSARGPRLRLTRMENVGQRATTDDFVPGETISDRGQLALSSAANDLVERLAQSGGRPQGLFRTLRAAARIADTPNRALCILTGADRARLDLFKRRVSLTWFVSW